MFKKYIKSLDARYFLLYVVCISAIALYGKYRCEHIKDHKDVLELELFKGSSKYGIDGWSITHFTFNAIIGYLYPKTVILSMVLGGIWELIETYMGIYKPKIKKDFGFCDMAESKTDDKTKVWWYGKKSDIVINFIGFMAGKTLRENL